VDRVPIIGALVIAAAWQRCDCLVAPGAMRNHFNIGLHAIITSIDEIADRTQKDCGSG
jgi:hypothetical protein